MLAQRAISGETIARDQLLRELEPMVVSTVRLVVGSNRWLAEDAAQEALLAIASGLTGLREPRAIRVWALRVATQRALRFARRERLRLLRQENIESDLAAEGPDPGRRSAIKESFDALPPKLRTTAVLRLHVGLSEDETAEVMGCSVGTVKSNLHDARRHLSAALTMRGYAPANRKEVL